MPDMRSEPSPSTYHELSIWSGIEDLHPLLGKQKQHLQGRMTWSSSKLIIGNPAIGEEEGFNVRSEDGLYHLAGDLEKADWPVVAEICVCTFFMQGGNVY